MNISFESEAFNIYDPKFSSDGEDVQDDTLDEMSLIEKGSDNVELRSRSSSNPSVAEERDTISLTPNAVTPNLSRIMGVCSISKIEQHSNLTLDSNN